MSQIVASFVFESRWALLLFPVMWLAVSGLLSYIGGWANLASRFAARVPNHGMTYRFASGSMGWRFLSVGYRNTLFVSLTLEGIGLSVFFPLRWMSPPLFIPWSEIESVTEEQHFLMRSVALKVRGHRGSLSLRGEAGRKAKEMYESSRP